MRVLKQLIRKKIVRRKKKSASLDLELCNRFQSGDFTAFPELSKCYAKLLKTVADKYANQGLPADELMLHAKIGLLKAAHRFDESKMVSFRLYAIWWMRQVALKALHEQARIMQVPEMRILQLHDIHHAFTRREDILLEGVEEANHAAKQRTSEILHLRKPHQPKAI